MSVPQSETPMMRQFNAIKKEHPDKLLFYRMGDFYEMFGDDAIVGAEILQIALPSRDKKKKNASGGLFFHKCCCCFQIGLGPPVIHASLGWGRVQFDHLKAFRFV